MYHNEPYKKRPFWFLLVFGFLLLPTKTFSQNISEYKVKSAFVLNFLKYTSWADDRFNQTLKICVQGEGPFLKALQVLSGRQFSHQGHTHKIVLHKKTNHDSVSQCNVLVFPQGNKNTSNLNHKNILTIGEHKQFISQGGILNFYSAGNKIRFEIHLEKAKKMGLTFSSQLLKLAKIRK